MTWMQDKLPSRLTIRRFVYWSLLIFLVGFFFFPKSKAHNTAYYALVLLPFLLTLRRDDILVYWQSSIFRLTGIFLIYLVFTLAWGEQTVTTDWTKYSKRLIYMLGFAGMIMSYFNFKYLNKLSLLISSVAIVMAVISMFLYDSNLYTGPNRLKNFGILEHEILAASTYGFAALMLVYGCNFASHYEKWIKMTGFTILVLDITWTQSRGPLLALMISLSIAEILRGKHRKSVSVFILGTLTTGLLMVTETINTPSFISRNGGDSYRLEIWQQIWQRVMDSPFIGLGLSANETIQLPACGCIPHPHNIFLATLFYGGLVGLMLLLAVLTYTLIIAYKQYKTHGQVIFLALFIFGVICGFSDGNKLIDHPRPMWLYFWLPILMIAAQQLNTQLQPKKVRKN